MNQGNFNQDPPVEDVSTQTQDEQVLVRPVRRQRKKPMQALLAALTPKKPARTRTLVFWTCVLSFVLIATIGIAIGMGFIRDWLIDFEYEATLPTVKSQAVFDSYFAPGNWAAVYQLSGQSNTKFENSNAFDTYMDNLVGDQPLDLVKVSAGLTQGYKFEVRLNGTKIASFTLREVTTDGKKDLVLDSMEVEFQRKQFCTVLTAPGNTVMINGVTLDSSYVVKSITTNANEYLPDGVTGYEAVMYRVDGLLVAPTVTVNDANGQAIALDYADNGYSHFIGSVDITDAESQALEYATKIYCQYMIGKVNKTTLQKYFDPSTNAFKTMVSIDKWMQSFTSYRFEDATITEYYRYSDTLYSARVKMSMYVTRKDGTEKEYPVNSTLIMELQDGTWKAIDMLNLSIQEQQVSVKLSYYDTDSQTLLKEEMVDADSKTLISPAVTVTEGKQLGWYIKVEDSNGNTTWKLMFLADENGLVSLPANNELEPMVLYARVTNKEA